MRVYSRYLVLSLVVLIETTISTTVYMRNNTQVGLSPDGVSYTRLAANKAREVTFGNCGCNTVAPEDKGICARILYSGVDVHFYEESACNGSKSLFDYRGPASEIYTCGQSTLDSNSIKIDCVGSG